ncbi:MAG TPA: ATP-binding protein [Candidatus Angelobacter sp.]|nr:ATP-binding protein [Candidatus Angelobacter sp.]
MEQEITQVLASAVQFLSEAVVLTETQSGLEKVIFLNEAFGQLTGYSTAELEGKDLSILRGPETENLSQLMNPQGAEQASPLVMVLYRKDGSPFWDRITRKKVSVGEKVYTVHVHSDVTRQRELRKRFILAQRREAAGHLVSGLAHDFNNLLTAILVYSGLLVPKVKEDSKLQRYLNEIRSSAERGAQLVAELMNLGREDTAEPEMVDLRELVEANTDLLKRVLGEDIRLSVVAAPDLHKTRVHRGRIQQILLNLANNSRDAMLSGGELVIQLSNHVVPSTATPPRPAPGNYVLLLVKDTGIGMDRETSANIFKPFFSTKRKGEGTGLGLFTVQTIVEQYGGYICVESEKGKGAAFKVLLPSA